MRKPLLQPRQQGVVVAILEIGQVGDTAVLGVGQNIGATLSRSIEVPTGKELGVFLPVLFNLRQQTRPKLMLDSEGCLLLIPVSQIKVKPL